MDAPRVLPDSRLGDARGSVMVDWFIEDYLPDGTDISRTIRLELVPIYCISCGKLQGYVPNVVSFASWMCRACAEIYGHEAAESDNSDRVFAKKVRDAMLEQFGRCLTQGEINELAEQGRLGQLGLLERESPFRKVMPS